MMGAQFMHYVQRSGVENFVAIGNLAACMA